jgi:hypothetical protein
MMIAFGKKYAFAEDACDVRTACGWFLVDIRVGENVGECKGIEGVKEIILE